MKVASIVFGAILLTLASAGVGFGANEVLSGGSDDGLDTEAFQDGFSDGMGDCNAGRDIDEDILTVTLTIQGEDWLAGTDDFGYGYDAGYSFCQADATGYNDGYDAGYTDGSNDACTELANEYNRRYASDFYTDFLYCE